MNGALLSSISIEFIDATLGVVVVFGSNEATDLTDATDGASFETILGKAIVGPSKLKSDEMPVLDLPQILLGVGASRPPFAAAEVAVALVLLNLLGLGSDLDLLDLFTSNSSGDLPARPSPFSPTRLS